MQLNFTNFYFEKRLLILYFVLFIFFLSSCNQHDEKSNNEIKNQLIEIENLSIEGKESLVKIKLNEVRAKLKENTPEESSYYSLIVNYHPEDPKLMDNYADSALLFFKNRSHIKKYPEEFVNALMAKGDAGMMLKNYENALNYYFEAKKILTKNNFDDGKLANRLGTFYFNQGNYKLAIFHWKESLAALDKTKLSKTKYFNLKQGALNNIGYFFFKSNQLDSALNYYLINLNFIHQSEQENILKKEINNPKIALYDNLGGLYLKKNNIEKAEDYLKKALEITSNDITIKMPVLIKLANIYTIKGEYAKADEVFQKSKFLLKLDKKDSEYLKLEWNKNYAAYLIKLNKPLEAYKIQQDFIATKDSIDSDNLKITQLNISRELNAIQQDRDLDILTHKDKVRRIYVAGIIEILILTVVIIILIYRNLRKSKSLQKETFEHNQKLQNALSELKHSNENYLRIMRVMAHDLRNPLSGITGLTAVLLDNDEFSDENKHILKLIESTGNHSLEMINELLKTSLADENELLEKHKIDVNELLNDSIKLLQFKAKEKQQQIIFEKYTAEPIFAKINKEKIWRVFNNLIINAVKFSPLDSFIYVNIIPQKDGVLISIKDYGIGINNADGKLIFDMFTSAKKTGTAGEQPFGLGLSISKKIIEKHNGEIWFESEIKKGTTFYLQIPY